MIEPEHQPLGGVAARGTLAMVGGQGGRIVLQLVSVAVLARLLTPMDYGLVAMVLAVVGIAELFRDLGLSNAALSATELSVAERDNLFWVNALVGLVLTVLVCGAAPLIALGYDEPALTAITLALAPTFLLSGLATQYRVSLLRDHRFSTLASLDLAVTAASLALGVLLAWQGAGYWALVGQQVFSGLAVLACLVVLARWLPRRFTRGTGTATTVRLGAGFLTSSLLSYVSSNADSVIIGATFGPVTLGSYNRALQSVRTPFRQLLTPVTTVVVPLLRHVRDDDERLVTAVVRAQLFVGYPLLAVAAVLAAGGPHVAPLLLGDGWDEVGTLMSIVAIGVAAGALGAPASWIFIARRLPSAMIRLSLVTAILTVSLIALGATISPEAAAAGYALAAVVSRPMTIKVACRAAGLDPSRLMRSSGRSAAVATAAGVVAYAAQSVVEIGDLASVALVVLCVAATFAALAVVPAVRRDLVAVVDMARLLRRERG